MSSKYLLIFYNTSSNFRNSLIQTLLLILPIILPVHTIIIRCVFLDVQLFDGLRYTCLVIGSQNPEVAEVTEILGDRLSDRSDDEVRAIRSVPSSGRNTNKAFSTASFPRNLEDFFPNLDFILIENDQLTSISSEDLAPWPNLAVFVAAYNSIESLDSDLFQHSSKLVQISFSNNFIQNVGLNLLSNLNEVAWIDFRNNPCINTVADTPQAIENLKILLIAQCPPLNNPEPPGQCVATCSMNEDVDELNTLVENQRLESAELFSEIDIIHSNLNNSNKLAAELEKLIGMPVP